MITRKNAHLNQKTDTEVHLCCEKIHSLLIKSLCLLLTAFILFPPLTLADADKTFTLGSKGNEVQQINKRLKELRYLKKGNSRQYTEMTQEAVRTFQRLNGLEETGEADPQTTALLFSDKATAAPWPTLVPLSTPAPPSVPELPAVDESGYLAGEGEFFYENEQEGQWIYLSANLQIYIHKYCDTSVPLEWFETEIRSRNGEAFHTVMTNPDKPGTQYRYPYDIARKARFVLGFSDDFYADRVHQKQKTGIIIREGKLLFNTTHSKVNHYLPNLDMMAQYPDGRLEVYTCCEKTEDDLLKQGAINVFSFGPIIIRDGEINEQLYTYYRSTEPRQVLGMVEPGHYWLFSVLGRMQSSRGTMLQRVAEMMKEKGVTQALNLDGGNTLALVFHGKILHGKATYKKKTFYRTVTSLIGIGYTDQWDE